MQKTFIMIKPGGVQKKLTGEIIKRFEEKGLNLCALRMVQLSREKAEELYSIHKGKPFFESLVDFVTSGPVVVGALSGDDVINVVREMMGATNPAEAESGTIRGDFAQEIEKNVIHGSDSVETANFEIPLFFREEDIVNA